MYVYSSMSVGGYTCTGVSVHVEDLIYYSLVCHFMREVSHRLKYRLINIG